MSTHRSSSDTSQTLSTQTTTQTNTQPDTQTSTQTNTGAAPMMFSTENKVQIQGLFRAESDEHDH